MAGKNKQSKDDAPNPNSVANRELFQRLNFLYQASAYLKGIEAPKPVPPQGDHNEEHPRNNPRKDGGKRRRATLAQIGSSYVQCMQIIGNKSVIRLDPNVKRTLCKGCDTVLFPGTTASVRIKGSSRKGHKVVYTCLACRTSRSIPAPPVLPSLGSESAPTSQPIVASTTSLQSTLESLEAPLAECSSRNDMPAAPCKRRKQPGPRPLPLFARPDAGHVVFRGNEVLRESQ